MKNILIIIVLFFSVRSSLSAQIIFLDKNLNIIQDTLIVKGKNLEYNFTIPTDSIQIRIANCDSMLNYSMIEVTHIRGKRIFGNYPFDKEGIEQDSLMIGSEKYEFISCCSCELIDSTNIISIKFAVDNIKTIGDIFLLSVKINKTNKIYLRKIFIKGEEDDDNSE